MNEIDLYIEEHSSAGSADENALLAELERATNLRAIHPRMVSGRVQGQLLTLITKMLRPHRVLEIGTFTGYSALSIAAGLDEGAEIHTVEIDDELEDIAREFFVRSTHGNKIRLHIGSALDVVPRLAGPFDLVFIDGDKREYPEYYRMVMGDGDSPPMVRPGSVILADNVLWYGKVVGPKSGEPGAGQVPSVETCDSNISMSEENRDRHTAGIVEFNRLVASDPSVENVILPLRDGINLIRVR